MTINIYPLFCLLALVAKPALEPPLGSWLRDRTLDPKRRENGLINVLVQRSRGHTSKGLSCKINAHVVQDCFVVEEGVLAMMHIFSSMWEVMVFQEVQLIITNLSSEVRAFAHPMRNGDACLEARLFAHLV